MPVYPDSLPAMFQHGAAFAHKVLFHYTGSIGQTILGYFAPGLVVIIAFVFKWGRDFWRPWIVLATIRDAMREHGKPWIKAGCWVYGFIFGWAGIQEVWKDHRGAVLEKIDLRDTSQQTAQTVSDLRRQLNAKDVIPRRDSPSFRVAFVGTAAFVRFSRTLGLDSCRIFTTEPSDTVRPDTGEFSYMILILGVTGGCSAANIREKLDKDSNVGAIIHQGDIAGTVVLHALPDTKGVVQLIDDLNVLFPVKRTYDFPFPVAPSDNAIWLQFGQGMKWKGQ